MPAFKPFAWLTPGSRSFLSRDYLVPGKSPEDRLCDVAANAERTLKRPGFAGRLMHGFERGWFSLSTPIWTNFGTPRGLPISCYAARCQDSIESILGSTHAEIAMMTKYGGGTALYMGDVRGRGAPVTGNGQSFGTVHFAKHYESLLTTCSQGSTRRGNIALYWPIDHPDVPEALGIKTEGHPVQDVQYGLCVKDAWLQAMVDGDAAKRELWARVLQARANTGFPYLFFTDNANKGAADVYRDKGLSIDHSQLCTEIMLPTSYEESFVCDLSSLNMVKRDEWKDTDAVETIVYLLDAVATEFIEKAEGLPFMQKAVRFAKRHRALGLGWVGWHSYLQANMIPFEGMGAYSLGGSIAKDMRAKAYTASEKLAGEYGEPELLKGYGRRNTTLLAIAPTKSSSFILGQASESVEPHRSNYFVKDLAKGRHTFRNPHLQELLASKGRDKELVWDDVLVRGGSVQHLDFLNAHEKAVFKTFAEISPREVVIQASGRQRWIDQGQSLNLFIPPATPAREVNAIHLEAWRLGLKSLYYQIGTSAAQDLGRNLTATPSTCVSCEA